jgi:hypothetical protein
MRQVARLQPDTALRAPAVGAKLLSQGKMLGGTVAGAAARSGPVAKNM